MSSIRKIQHNPHLQIKPILDSQAKAPIAKTKPQIITKATNGRLSRFPHWAFLEV